MLKMYIDNEEVVSKNDFTIKEEMLSASSTILNNTYPKSWETDHDYISRFYYPKDYSKLILNKETYFPHLDGSTIEGTSFQINADTSLEDEYYFKGNTTQNGTPTPTSPIPINVATGLQDVNVCGNNLANIEDIVIGKSWNNANNGVRATILYIPVERNQTYSISSSYTNTHITQIRWVFNDGASLNAVPPSPYNNTSYDYVSIEVIADTTFTSDMLDGVKIMFNKGNTALPYEPYIGKDYEIDLPVENYVNNTTGTITNNDITYTQNENGSITANGTSSGVSYYNITKPTLQAGTYTLSGCPSGGSVNSSYKLVMEYNGTSAVDIGNGATFTINSETTATQFYIEVRSGKTLDNLLFNIQIEKGTKANHYTPYGTTPIELCKIGTYQDRIFKSSGKNLLDSLIQGVIDTNTGEFISNPNTEYRVSENYIKVDSNKVGVSYLTSGTKQIVLFEYKSDYTYITYQVASNNSNLFTLNSNTKYIKIRLRGAGVEITDIKNAMVSNDSVLPYEPYGSGKWYLYKEIGEVVLDGSETGWSANTSGANKIFYRQVTGKSGNNIISCSNYFKYNSANNWQYINNNEFTMQLNSEYIFIRYDEAGTLTNFKTWLSTHPTSVYYALATPTCTEITDIILINELESIELLNGLNNLSITSANLSAIMNLHYNYQTEHTDVDTIFSGMVKNTNNISLNPREPKYCGLEILDYKTLLSEGKTLDYVISNKTILEAITMVVNSISEYGFELGNVNILNGDEIIGAYSTENKTAYDVLQYLADISGAKWNCRRKDNNSMYIDFYDPTLMPRGTQIDYTTEWACDNNLVDLKFNYGTRDYRNKQIILSDEVEGNVEYNTRLTSDGITREFILPYKVASVDKIEIDNIEQSVGTKEDKEIGIYADFYYSRNTDTITSNKLLPYGTLIDVSYIPIIKGREVVQNDNEIDRLSNQLEVNGTISRYENRNDTTDSNKLINIGETYLRYKGEAEITLTIKTFNNNLYNVGQIVYFNAPIPELQRDYLVKSKQIQVISSDEDILNIFYIFTLSSSFNAEKEINWFDNQRAKTEGNIGEGEFISRNIDINSKANIIWDNLRVEEVSLPSGASNDLQASLEAPIIH